MEWPGALEEQERVLIGPDENNPIPYIIKSINVKGRNLTISLDGIDSIEASEAIAGHFLYLPRQWLPPLDEDEYYWSDIIGLDVMSEDGKKLGVVTAIIPTGSNDVYVCEGSGGELLLPAFEDVIVKIDVPRGILTVKLPKEL